MVASEDLSGVTYFVSCEELTHWKRLWCWEGLGAGGEGDDRGGDGWIASLTWWTWVWVNSGSWWWTGRPGMLWFMGSQRVGHDWATELNWTYFVGSWYLLAVSWELSARSPKHVLSIRLGIFMTVSRKSSVSRTVNFLYLLFSPQSCLNSLQPHGL